MTSGELAVELFNQLDFDCNNAPGSLNEAESIEAIENAIRQAIQEEREACAKLVEERGNYHGVYSTIDPKITAKAIRERK
jgi:hypothetical protein